MDYVLLLVGFFLLIKGADIFVDGASAIAKKVGIPAVIVGLTIVSIGTSAPELAVSIISSIGGNNELAVGNVLGSNIFNSLVVLGGTALVAPILFKKITIKRDFIVNLAVGILLFVFGFFINLQSEDGLSRIEGAVLFVLCIVYILSLIRSARQSNAKEEGYENVSVLKKSILLICGAAGIVIGGNFVVDSATNIAVNFGMSQKLVGLTIVAMGTSLPELVTSIVASLKGENEIALGNVLGSNIFNILLILGTSSVISPIKISGQLAFDFIFFILISVFIGILIFYNTKKEDKKLGRLEGLILVLLYIAYLIFIIMRN